MSVEQSVAQDQPAAASNAGAAPQSSAPSAPAQKERGKLKRSTTAPALAPTTTPPVAAAVAEPIDAGSGAGTSADADASAAAPPASAPPGGAAKKSTKQKKGSLPVAPIEAPPPPASPPEITFRQGQYCIVGEHRGVIQYVGHIASLGPGVWVGVQFDRAVGQSNGFINGRHIFDCPSKHGGFYRLEEIISAPLDDAGTQPPQGRLPTRPSPPPSPDEIAGGGVLAESGASSSAAASQCVAAGRGLETAVVHQLSQFVITAYDEHGRRVVAGADPFHVFVRGVHPPSKLRVKLHDHGDGHYTGEYKAEVSGLIEVAITLGGEPIFGSPFEVSAVTLQAQPSRCLLRGEALRTAVARRAETFAIEFVDTLGNPAVAEELDLRVERIEPVVMEVDPEDAARQEEGEDGTLAARVRRERVRG